MDIEIVDAYVQFVNKKTGIVKGTIHIFVPEDSIDVRGINFMFNVKKSFLLLDHFTKTTYDFEENKMIKYPCFSYMDHGKFQDYMKCVLQNAREWFKENRTEIIDKAKIVLEKVKKHPTFKKDLQDKLRKEKHEKWLKKKKSYKK